MTKKLGAVIVLIVISALFLSGCKRPASQGPVDIPEQEMTTPIVIQTDSPMLATQTEAAKSISTATLAPGEEAIEPPTTTPEPTEVIVIPTMTVPEEYTVKEGEVVYCLARRFDVNPEDIISLNGLPANGAISIDQVLQIPQTGSYPHADRTLIDHPTTYTVQANETIYTIACKFGDVYPEEIIAANNLEKPYQLTTGQTLNIP